MPHIRYRNHGTCVHRYPVANNRCPNGRKSRPCTADNPHAKVEATSTSTSVRVWTAIRANSRPDTHTSRGGGGGRGVSERSAGKFFQHLGDQRSNGRALAARQCHVREQRVSLQPFDDGDDSIVPSDSKVVALCDVVREYHT
jgi:hypothetical protein